MKAVERRKEEEAALILSGSSFRPRFSRIALCTKIRELWFVKAGREMQFLELVRRTERQRGYGDWYGFMLVAQGSGEIMCEHGVHAWDIAGIIPIVEEAGGRFSDWDGKIDIHRPDTLATNGKLHDEVLGILASDGKGSKP